MIRSAIVAIAAMLVILLATTDVFSLFIANPFTLAIEGIFGGLIVGTIDYYLHE